MRTYSREEYLRSKEAWADFGPEWTQIRKLASAWSIFPPAGTKHDDRDAENPSQRAIVYRALIDNPTELRRILVKSRSWSQVVDRIIGIEERLRSEADDNERDTEWDKADQPTHRQAVMSLGAILERLEQSRG